MPTMELKTVSQWFARKLKMLFILSLRLIVIEGIVRGCGWGFNAWDGGDDLEFVEWLVGLVRIYA